MGADTCAPGSLFPEWRTHNHRTDSNSCASKLRIRVARINARASKFQVEAISRCAHLRNFSEAIHTEIESSKKESSCVISLQSAWPSSCFPWLLQAKRELA